MVGSSDIVPSYRYVFLGAPMGGLATAFVLADTLRGDFAFAEKKVTAVTTIQSREESKLILNRHELFPGSRIIVVEDVCNNFSTTEQIKKLVEEVGCQLFGIACLLNRSEATEWNGVPVVSLMHIPTAQWRQDDPAVAEDVAKGNVAWKPKAEWPKLQVVMSAHPL